MNGVVQIGKGFHSLDTAKRWLKQGRIHRLPGQLKWEFVHIPAEGWKQMLIENLARRVGNNLAQIVNDRVDALVRFSHELREATEGEKTFRKQQRLGELWKICTEAVLDEFTKQGNGWEVILETARKAG